MDTSSIHNSSATVLVDDSEAFFFDFLGHNDVPTSPCVNISIAAPGGGNGSVVTCVDPGLLIGYAESRQDIALKQPMFYIAVIALYTIVILLGTIANIGVVITIAKTTVKWNATTIYIVNLALADVFICTFDLPLSAYYQIRADWLFGETMCHLLPALFATAVYDSAFTLILIALDRFILVVYPFSAKLSRNYAIASVIGVKIVSFAAASPISIFADLRKVEHAFAPDADRTYCLESWPSARSRAVYTVATLMFQYCIPMLIICCLYAAIFYRLRQRTNLREKRFKLEKTNRILLAVVGVFALSWLPYHIFSLLSELNYNLVKGRFYSVADAMLRLFAMSSSCINPFLYGWFNENYRNSFLHLIQQPKKVTNNYENSYSRRESEQKYRRSSSLSSAKTKSTIVSYSCEV